MHWVLWEGEQTNKKNKSEKIPYQVPIIQCVKSTNPLIIIIIIIIIINFINYY